jgi:hypothetical protein
LLFSLKANLCVLFIKKKTGKEARRKELKKNKKQRLQVRQAVIKQKDPKHLLSDMELLDKMGKLIPISFLPNSLMLLNTVF